jgi:hypothetical protein
MLHRKVVKGNRAEWVAPPSLVDAASVIISPNLNSPFASFICEHAAPQVASEEAQVIACEICYEALATGADIAVDYKLLS